MLCAGGVANDVTGVHFKGFQTGTQGFSGHFCPAPGQIDLLIAGRPHIALLTEKHIGHIMHKALALAQPIPSGNIKDIGFAAAVGEAVLPAFAAFLTADVFAVVSGVSVFFQFSVSVGLVVSIVSLCVDPEHFIALGEIILDSLRCFRIICHRGNRFGSGFHRGSFLALAAVRRPDKAHHVFFVVEVVIAALSACVNGTRLIVLWPCIG